MKDSWPMEILDGQSLSKSWLVCPIHRLPTELVLLIFTYATSFVTQTDGLDLDFFDFPVEITVIHISQTCSLWRSISFAVPSLWANIRIAIDVVQHVSQFNSVVGCLDVLLRGSGEAPLTILIRDLDPDVIAEPESSSSSPAYRDVARRKVREHVFPSLFVLSDRWFSVTFIGSIRYTCVCSNLLKGCFPLLRHLDIASSELYLFQNAVNSNSDLGYSFDCDISDDTGFAVAVPQSHPQILIGNISSLRVKCIISDPPRANIALSRLRELVYEGPMQLGVVYSLVRNCAGTLERLCCRFSKPNRPSLSRTCQFDDARWKIHLTRLKSLDISWGRARGIESVSDDEDEGRRMQLVASLALPTNMYLLRLTNGITGRIGSCSDDKLVIPIVSSGCAAAAGFDDSLNIRDLQAEYQ